jgi:hypothetical protein
MGGIMGMPATGQFIQAATTGNWKWAQQSLGNVAGLNNSGVFELSRLFDNMKPLIAGVAVHKIATMIGVNRVIAKAKIPLIRI